MKWFYKGAILGDVESIAHVGAAYLMGLMGVQQNYGEALEWLRQAAEKGDVTAQANLGVCYYQGFGKYPEAVKWTQIAAGQGDAAAQYHLGNLYHLGHGLPQSPAEAFSWWLKAAQGNHPNAQNNVALLYKEGEVVAQDIVEAHKWMRLAAEHGFAGAGEEADEIATKMTSEQREESQRRIAHSKAMLPRMEQPQGEGIIARIARMVDRETMRRQGQSDAEDTQTNQRSRTISPQVRREVWRRDEGKCVKCGSRERLEFDHIVPYSEGGSNTARNIELLCESCNRAKADAIQ